VKGKPPAADILSAHGEFRPKGIKLEKINVLSALLSSAAAKNREQHDQISQERAFCR
jgi:hypothetical protein